jgi:hypothetical protein
MSVQTGGKRKTADSSGESPSRKKSRKATLAEMLGVWVTNVLTFLLPCRFAVLVGMLLARGLSKKQLKETLSGPFLVVRLLCRHRTPAASSFFDWDLATETGMALFLVKFFPEAHWNSVRLVPLSHSSSCAGRMFVVGVDVSKWDGSVTFGTKWLIKDGLAVEFFRMPSYNDFKKSCERGYFQFHTFSPIDLDVAITSIAESGEVQDAGVNLEIVKVNGVATSTYHGSIELSWGNGEPVNDIEDGDCYLQGPYARLAYDGQRISVTGRLLFLRSRSPCAICLDFAHAEIDCSALDNATGAQGWVDISSRSKEEVVVPEEEVGV